MTSTHWLSSLIALPHCSSIQYLRVKLAQEFEICIFPSSVSELSHFTYFTYRNNMYHFLCTRFHTYNAVWKSTYSTFIDKKELINNSGLKVRSQQKWIIKPLLIFWVFNFFFNVEIPAVSLLFYFSSLHNITIRTWATTVGKK